MTILDHLELARQLGAYLASRRRARDPDAVRDWQGRMLRRLVKDAWDNVPLYRRKYEAAGVRPEAIRSLEDLDRLPILTKRELARAGPDDIRNASLPPRRSMPVKTSGSTGVPLVVFKDRALMARYSFIKVALPVGLDMSWRKPRLPRVLGIFAVGPGALEKTIMDAEPAYFRLLPRVWSYLDARSDPAVILAALEGFKPDIVMTYPSVLAHLTEAVRRDLRRPGHRPRVWVLSAEVLTPRLREEAGAAFGGEIFDLYSSVEAVNIARDCGRHRGLHLQSDEVVFEVLDGERPAPPGAEGDVVVTDLWNRATPIIRYAGLRDRAALDPGPCPCGNLSPRLVRIAGRRPGALRLPGGRTVHPYALTLALESVKDVAAFQVVQTSRDEVRALIVPRPAAADGGGPDALKADVEAVLLKVLGPGVSLTVEPVPEIPGSSEPGHLAVRSLDLDQAAGS